MTGNTGGAIRILLVESFVDETRGYRGTCYRACGFEAVGLTAGYKRHHRDYYQSHNEPKQLYMRALKKSQQHLLSQSSLPSNLSEHELIQKSSHKCPFKAEALGSLLDLFRQSKDPRRVHGLRHPQSFVLACASIAMLMGAGSYQAMEDICSTFTQRHLCAIGARKDRIKERYKAPSDSTFFRVLKQIDVQWFDEVLGHWLGLREPDCLECIAVDGKTLRGSGCSDGKALQLISAVTHRLRACVAQRAIEKKAMKSPPLCPC